MYNIHDARLFNCSHLLGENLLKKNDLRNLAQSLFRERHKDLPKLFKHRGDAHDAPDVLDFNTTKDEHFIAHVMEHIPHLIITYLSL
jgi:hypothetical protein